MQSFSEDAPTDVPVVDPPCGAKRPGEVPTISFWRFVSLSKEIGCSQLDLNAQAPPGPGPRPDGQHLLTTGRRPALGKEFTDSIAVHSGEPLKCHGVVLVFASPVFRRMLASPTPHPTSAYRGEPRASIGNLGGLLRRPRCCEDAAMGARHFGCPRCQTFARARRRMRAPHRSGKKKAHSNRLSADVGPAPAVPTPGPQAAADPAAPGGAGAAEGAPKAIAVFG